jgi:2-oxo-4-hydroxy-4-carboxy-5-ureidoimidazoline decarboxylase
MERPMTIAEFDHLDREQKKNLLYQCCGSTAWVEKMLSIPPANDLIDLFEDAEEKWYECTERDWLEAFSQHPKIGDLDSLKKKFADTAHWAAGEQSDVKTATQNVLEELAKANKLYEEKFGYIFIVCATGKSAEEMLNILNERLKNKKEAEIKIAMEEQNKITQLRLEKLFS